MKYFEDSYQTFRIAWRLISLWAIYSGIVCAYADSELTNWKGGIDVLWGGAKGTAYQEEYWFHDKLVNDTKAVWIRADTTISMRHNDRNMGTTSGRGKVLIGADGGGLIRYKIDEIWKEGQWAPNWD